MVEEEVDVFMKYIKLIYLLIFLTILLSSCATVTRIRPDGLSQALEEHKILDLRKTRVEHVVVPNLVRFTFHLHDVDFRRHDLRAIGDTMSLYLQSDEFIAFVESKNHIGLFYDHTLVVRINIMIKNGNAAVKFNSYGIKNFKWDTTWNIR